MNGENNLSRVNTVAKYFLESEGTKYTIVAEHDFISQKSQFNAIHPDGRIIVGDELEKLRILFVKLFVQLAAEIENNGK